MVLDVMMPGMDGFETLEEIRKENSLPILMFTSKNDSISKVDVYKRQAPFRGWNGWNSFTDSSTPAAAPPSGFHGI